MILVMVVVVLNMTVLIETVRVVYRGDAVDDNDFNILISSIHTLLYKLLPESSLLLTL